MYMYMYMYIHIYIYTGMPLMVESGSAGGRGLPGHSQSLTVLVEVGYFAGVALGILNSDFPQQRPGSTQLPLAQPGSDCAQNSMSISEVCF